MSVIKKMRRQKAIWWPLTGLDRYGHRTYGPPTEVSCRWDDKGEEFRDKDNQVAVSNAVVYVDRVMSIGDKLKKGSMESDTLENPSEDRAAFEIKRFDQTPNFKATEFLLTAYL